MARKSFSVFLSHRTRDEILARRFATVLDTLYLPTFVYGAQRIGGQNRFQVIRDKISECPYFVVLLTQYGKRSQWVNQEIGFAAAKDKVLIPLVETKKRGKRISYYGFLETSDPINLNLNDVNQAISELILSLFHSASPEGKWRDRIKLKCKCGWHGSMAMKYRKQDLRPSTWDCPKCKAKIQVSPVTYEPLPQID